MNEEQFLDLLEQAAALHAALLKRNELEVETGQWLNSIVLRLHKKQWANAPLTRPQKGGAAIFFSIWLNNSSEPQQQFFYNIHAFKIREFKNYKLTSRNFADAFRKEFKRLESQWPNVRTDFGPLNLMEGWEHINIDTSVTDVSDLIYKFIDVANIIDRLLKEHAKI